MNSKISCADIENGMYFWDQQKFMLIGFCIILSLLSTRKYLIGFQTLQYVFDLNCLYENKLLSKWKL